MSDIKIRLRIGEQGIETRQTQRITGKLKAFIITYTGSFPVTIHINSELGYPILRLDSFSGTEYIVPSIQPKDFRGWGFSYGNEEYKLDEKLNISVQGEQNEIVQIIVRT